VCDVSDFVLTLHLLSPSNRSFPGVGLGVLAAGSTKVTDHAMLLAARTLAAQVTDEELAVGCVYPALSRIRLVSEKIAVAVANQAVETGLATKIIMPEDMEDCVGSLMYDPFAELEGVDNGHW